MQERWKGFAFFFLMFALVAIIFAMDGPSFGIGATVAAVARHLIPVSFALFLVAIFIGLVPAPRKPTAG